MNARDLLALAERQRQSIIERRQKLEEGGIPILDIEWQFASGMVSGAGEIVRAMAKALENEESGRPVSAERPVKAQISAVGDDWISPDQPDITISGRPEETCDAYQTRAGKDYYCDRGAGHVDPHHNGNVGEWAGDMRGERGVPAEFVEGRFAMPLVTSDELARRDGPPRVGRGADFPRDDGTYVVEVVPDPPRAPAATDCPSCDGRGVVWAWLATGGRHFACKACDGTGRKKEERHV